MMNRGQRIGNRNMTITAPLIGSAELRPDLEMFATEVVLDAPSFDNAHLALMNRAKDWFENDMDQYGAARKAQLLSGQRLGGVALQRLACHAEEAYQQFHQGLPEMRQQHE